MSSILPDTMKNNPRWSINAYHGYSPNETGNLYAPYTAKKDNIGQLSKLKTKEAAIKSLCSACGKSIGNRLAVFLKETAIVQELLQGYKVDKDWVSHHEDEPPLHVECARYTALACPHIQENKWDAIICEKWNVLIKKKSAFSPNFNYSYRILNYQEFLEYSKKYKHGYKNSLLK